MKRGALTMVLLASLATAGPGSAAGPVSDPVAELATPRVSCDLLDVRTDVPRVGSNAAWANPGGGAPAIRQVGGRGARLGGGSSGFLKVGLDAGQAMPVAMELGPRTVSVPPGTTALIEIAIDHLNRIVTPFRNPVVHTVSPASTSVDGRVVYVATATEEPVALYIGDGPSSELALSLTLAPRFVPPREIRLEVPGYRSPRAAVSESAGEGPAARLGMPVLGGETGGNQPYAEAVADLLRAMAQQRLPDGYRIAQDTAVKARCVPGLKILKTQLTQGPAGSVLAVRVRHTGTGTVPADRTACDADSGQVAAVGAWPLKVLGPGQETEVFLVLQDGPGGAAAAGNRR